MTIVLLRLASITKESHHKSLEIPRTHYDIIAWKAEAWGLN